MGLLWPRRWLVVPVAGYEKDGHETMHLLPRSQPPGYALPYHQLEMGSEKG